MPAIPRPFGTEGLGWSEATNTRRRSPFGDNWTLTVYGCPPVACCLNLSLKGGGT
ncbi:MAG: hypothetical protein ACE5OZ_19795 [Candidatus Heimdallarchaeota archaeon]